MCTYEQVRNVLEARKPHYDSLLEKTKIFVSELKRYQAEKCIYRIYTRSDSQNGEEYKSISKILEKLDKWKAKSRNTIITDIHDIIGLTIVTYYPDEVLIVKNLIGENCKSYNLEISPYIDQKEMKDFKLFGAEGYYACHLKLTYPSDTNLKDLSIEIQIKTVLNDALSSKMQNLIYKPQGSLNKSHKRLMISIADSVQAIDIQSENLRDLIKEEWEYHKNIRHVARVSAVKTMNATESTTPMSSLMRIYKECLKTIEANEEQLARADSKDPLVVKIDNIISDLQSKKDEGISLALRLSILLSTIRPDEKFNHKTKSLLEKWKQHQKDTEFTIFMISSVYYFMGERGVAISALKDYFSNLSDNSEPSDKFYYMKLNLLCYLLEEAEEKEAIKEELKPEIDKLINEVSVHFNDFPAFVDTKGMYKVVYAKSAEDIENGLKLIQSAYNEDKEGQEGILYSKAHARLAMRKLSKLPLIPVT